MPLLKTEAEKLSNNDLQAGIIEELIDKDQMFAMVPFTQTNGKAYVYNRENTISEAVFINPNEAVTEEASDFTEVTTNLRVLIGDVDVDKFLDSTLDDTNPQKAIQVAQKVKGIGRKYARTIVNGDNGTNAKEFDGMKKLVTATGNTMAINGASAGALTLDALDELLDMVPNGADALVMRSGTFRAMKSLWRAAGGNTGGMLQLDNFGMVPAHDGTPILVNDYVGTEDYSGTDGAHIYAVRFNEVDGFHGLFGGEAGGIMLEDIGTVQNKDATRTRVKWYCGAALKSTQSLAALKGIQNI
jgi:hypothetical protein